jgi:hypothetical protein
MKRISLLVGVLFILMAPSVAFAQSSSCESSTGEQYGAETCPALTSTASTSPGTATTDATGTTATSAASTLPFTGLDVVLLVVGGGALLSAGFVVRRVSRRLN